MRIDYYIGIIPEDADRFKSFVEDLNSSLNDDLHIEIKSEYDDPYGYYTYVIKGTWSSYRAFLNKTNEFIKSVEHFEED